MTLKVFAVYDTKGLVYGVPFFMGTIGTAVRAFSDLASDKQSAVSKHPSDYILFQIGEYDDSKGGLVSVSPPRNLGMGSDFISSLPGDKQLAEDHFVEKSKNCGLEVK